MDQGQRDWQPNAGVETLAAFSLIGGRASGLQIAKLQT